MDFWPRPASDRTQNAGPSRGEARWAGRREGGPINTTTTGGSRPYPNKAACARGPRTRPGVELQRGSSTAKRGCQRRRRPRTRPGHAEGVPGPSRAAEEVGRGTTGLASARRAEPGSGARRRGARLGLRATRAVGPPRASGARAPVGPGARRVVGRSRHPGRDRAQATTRGGPAEGGSERAGGRARERVGGCRWRPRGERGRNCGAGLRLGARGGRPGSLLGWGPAPRPPRRPAGPRRRHRSPGREGGRGDRALGEGSHAGRRLEGRARGVVRRLRRAGMGSGQRPCVRGCLGGLLLAAHTSVMQLPPASSSRFSLFQERYQRLLEGGMSTAGGGGTGGFSQASRNSAL